MATTAARDQDIQRVCREINQSKNFNFNVDVWSWDDIESEIGYRPAIMAHYFPMIQNGPDDRNKVKLTRHSSRDRMAAFITRPGVIDNASKQFKNYFLSFLHELADNAYRHGTATFFEIEINEGVVVIQDNGFAFNPLTELDASKASSTSHIGSFTIQNFIKIYEGLLRVRYQRQDDKNFLHMDFDKDAWLDKENFLEIPLNMMSLISRTEALRFVQNIPLDKKEIIFNVDSLIAASSFVEVVRGTLDRMDDSQKLTVSVPRNSMAPSFHQFFGNDPRLDWKVR